jgi:hypothetical protein
MSRLLDRGIPMPDFVPPPPPVSLPPPSLPRPAAAGFGQPSVSGAPAPPWLTGPNGQPGVKVKAKKPKALWIGLGVVGAVLIGSTAWNALHETVTLADVPVGQCVPSMAAAKAMSDLRTVPCSKPHGGQVYYSSAYLDTTLRSFPGVEAARSEASDQCKMQLPPSIANAPNNDDWKIFYISPSQREMWKPGARIICVVTFPEPQTGSLVEP